MLTHPSQDTCCLRVRDFELTSDPYSFSPLLSLCLALWKNCQCFVDETKNSYAFLLAICVVFPE